jgi:hypothetical protein
VEITPRPATIVAGSPIQLAARAIDETGAVVPGAHVNFYVIYDTPVQYGGWDGKRYDLAERADLTTPGHRRFIARFLTLADTLDLQVVPRTSPPRGRARVFGTVLDAAGRPIIRTYICRDPRFNSPKWDVAPCATPDTAGRYVLDGLPAGVQILSASCSGERMMSGALVAQDTVDVADGQEQRLDMRGSSAGCDMRPYVMQRAIYEGVYTSGFEESGFYSCHDSIRAWASFAPTAFASGIKWPKPTDESYPSYFVRWRGTLQGPWHFGHMGGSSYDISVDSVLMIRQAGRSDCRDPMLTTSHAVRNGTIVGAVLGAAGGGYAATFAESGCTESPCHARAIENRGIALSAIAGGILGGLIGAGIGRLWSLRAF